MKRAALVTLLLTVSTLLALPLHAEEMPKQELQMYHIVLVKEGPNWKSQGSEKGMDVRMQVIENIRKAAQSGLIVSAGLVNDETDVEFIVIFDVETKTEAYNLIMEAPNVKNGFFRPEIYSYFAPKGLAFKK
jgi:hypothetical protein